MSCLASLTFKTPDVSLAYKVSSLFFLPYIVFIISYVYNAISMHGGLPRYKTGPLLQGAYNLSFDKANQQEEGVEWR